MWMEVVKLFPDTREIFGVTGKKNLQSELPVLGGKNRKPWLR
jgi:hypothetical protein